MKKLHNLFKNYTNYILLSSETIFNNNQMLGFITVEHNIKVNNYSFFEEDTDNNSPINYIWNVCKNIEYNNYKKYSGSITSTLDIFKNNSKIEWIK